MTNTKKAPAGAPTPTGTTERDLNRLTSQDDFTTFPGARQVSAYLMRGAANAISARDLATLMGYRDTRPLREAVERERREGKLILISSRGYFLPDYDEATAEQEIARFVHLMDARARTNRAAVHPCKVYLRRRKRREIQGQRGLFNEE